jgi:hypothetical protein
MKTLAIWLLMTTAAAAMSDDGVLASLSKEQIAKYREGMHSARRHCAKEWPDDFHMRLWCEDTQLKALEELIRRDAELGQ